MKIKSVGLNDSRVKCVSITTSQDKILDPSKKICFRGGQDSKIEVQIRTKKQ